MGASASLQQYITTNVKFQQIVKSTLNIGNNTNIGTLNMNRTEIVNGASGVCCCTEFHPNGSCKTAVPGCGISAEIKCNLKQYNNSDTKITAINTIDSTVSQELRSKLINEITQDIESKLKQVEKSDLTSIFGGLTLSQIQNKIINDIDEKITTEMMVKLVNNTVVKTNNFNTNTITNCGILSGDTCTLDNNVSNNILINNIITSIATQLSQVDSLNKLYSVAKGDLDQQRQGAWATFVEAVSDFFKNWWIFLLIGGGIFLILILIGVFIYMSSTTKESRGQDINKLQNLIIRAASRK